MAIDVVAGQHWCWLFKVDLFSTLQWRHKERDDVSNHQPHGCLLNRLLKTQNI